MLSVAILKINMATPHEAVPEENIDFQGETENKMEILYADNTETASNVIELTSNFVLTHEEDEVQARVEIPRTPTSEIITTRGRSTHVRTPSKRQPVVKSLVERGKESSTLVLTRALKTHPQALLPLVGAVAVTAAAPVHLLLRREKN